MKSHPYLWCRPSNSMYYVVYYDGPLGERKRMESLKTRDHRTAQDRFYLWKKRQETSKVRDLVELGDAIDEYLLHYAQRNKEASVQRYRSSLENVAGWLGKDHRLVALTAKDLQDYQLDRVSSAEKSTVDYELDVMRAFLNWCRKRDWVEDNVADQEHVERLTSKGNRHKVKRVFTDEELDGLLSPHPGGYWQISYIFNALYYTGMRIGELAHLTADDVDFSRLELAVKEKTIDVPVWNQARGEVEGRRVHWTPKWYEERVIPIEERLEPVLREYDERRLENRFWLYFYGKRGTLITDHLGRQVKALAGSDDVSTHTFRHTHISHALNHWGRPQGSCDHDEVPARVAGGFAPRGEKDGRALNGHSILTRLAVYLVRK